MPTDIDDAKTGGNDLLFASELEGIVFRLLEASVYESEEVQEKRDDDSPEWGRWMPAVTRDGTRWLAAPGELIQELQNIDADPTAVDLRVTRCEKSGSDQSDPYEVNVVLHDEDATELPEARPEGYWESFA